VGQNPEDIDATYWIYPFTWDWGCGNADIPFDSGRRTPGVVASNLDLSGRDLRNARIHLEGGRLCNINFDGANLEGADFTDTILENCSFRETNLKHVRFDKSPSGDFTDAVFSIRHPEALFAGHFRMFSEEQLRSSWNFKNGGIIDIMLRDGRIKLEDLRYDQLPLKHRTTAENVFRTHEFRQKSLAGLTISGVDFSNCDFSGFTLGYFENCKFDNANFTDAVIICPSVFGDPLLRSTQFGFRACNLTEEQMKQTRFWQEGNLTGFALERMNLNGWDFSNKNLSHASFERSSLKDANFDNAILLCTNFYIDIGSYSVAVYPEEKFTIEQLKQTKSWKERTIIDCKFYQVNFDDCNLRGFDFQNTEFISCSFKNADLTGAVIQFRFNVMNYGLTEQQLRSIGNFRENMLKPVYLWE